jgi:hypothetical protein
MLVDDDLGCAAIFLPDWKDQPLTPQLKTNRHSPDAICNAAKGHDGTKDAMYMSVTFGER